MAKQNCWEAKACGREPGGVKVAEFGVCSAAEERKLNGTNRGTNAGRACWIVAGTLCGGKVQGSFAAKMPNCLKCDFYLSVKGEEGIHFETANEMLAKLGAGAR